MTNFARPPIPAAPQAIDGAILFFYYDDLDAAAYWYHELLGLDILMREEWLVLLQLRPGCTVGLVDAIEGNHLPPRGGNQGAMLSIETNQIEAWLERFKVAGHCPPDTSLISGCRGRTLEFRVHDPGGYMVEFFHWLDRP